MDILFISAVYPNSIDATKGLFNRYLVEALGHAHDVSVVSPVSWTDELRSGGRARRELKLSRSELMDGGRVRFPRYYYPPKLFRSSYGWFYWRSVCGSVRRLMERRRPDAVVGFWAHPDGTAAVRAAREAGVPSAVIVGGSDVLLLGRDPARRRSIRWGLEQADAVITVSSDLRNHVIALGIRPEKVHLWSRGINASVFSPGDRAAARARLGIPAGDRAVIWVGRMVPVKGLDILLESLALVQSRGVECHLYLLGDGPLRSDLVARTEALGISARVTFVGPKLHDELPDWYRAADLTVLPSRSEGLPNVLRESLACGTPFVASNVGGIAEIADPSFSLLVPPEDHSSLADAIEQALARWGGRNDPIAPLFPTWDEAASSLVRILQPYVTARSLQAYSGLGSAAPVS